MNNLFSIFQNFKRKTDFKYFSKLANAGDADAQFNLGNCYASAHGTYLDHNKAEEWWKKAADQGHEDAQHNLTVLLKKDENQ